LASFILEKTSSISNTQTRPGKVRAVGMVALFQTPWYAFTFLAEAGKVAAAAAHGSIASSCFTTDVVKPSISCCTSHLLPTN